MGTTATTDDALLSINDAAKLSGHSVATYRWYRANGIAWMAAQEEATSRGGVET